MASGLGDVMLVQIHNQLLRGEELGEMVALRQHSGVPFREQFKIAEQICHRYDLQFCRVK